MAPPSRKSSRPSLKKVSSAASYDRDRQPDDPLARVTSMNVESEDVYQEKEIAEEALRQHRDVDDDDNDYDDEVVAADDQFESDSNNGNENEKGAKEPAETRHEVRRTKSHATDVSATTQATSHHHESPGEDAKRPWYKKLNLLKWGKVPPVPEEREVSHEYNANFLSKLFFSWQAPMMVTGYKRPLQKNDIWTVNPDRSVNKMSMELDASFKRRVAQGQKYPLLWALHEIYAFEFWVGGMCQLSSTIMQVMSPFTLRYLIQFATDAYLAQTTGSPAPNIGRGLGLVIGVTGMQILQSLGTNHFIYKGMLIGGMSRAALISLIYEKSMVVSGRARAGGKAITDNPESHTTEEVPKKKKKESKKNKKEQAGSKGNAGVSGDGIGWGNGRVVSLMSVDTWRIDHACGLFHLIWTAPLSCLITLALLIVNLTYSALSGFALLVIGLPLLTQAIKSLSRRRQLINKITDQRVSLTQEILQSVRFVKYFGWESSFLKRLGEMRSKEISMIQRLFSIRNMIMAVSLSLPIFASMLSFITYTLSSHGLAAAEVFSSLALFNGLRMPLNLLPLVIGQVTDAWNSLQRIQEYLLLEEQSDEATFKPDAHNAVEMHDATFTWERTPTQENDDVPGSGGKKNNNKQSSKEKDVLNPAEVEDDGSTLVDEREPFKLQDISFEIGRNELVAVIGSVGSGKTSLLAALAGDMRRTNGEVILGASRAFCPQYAWIQNSTVKENILFGKDMDRSWYKKVIKACALQQDLDMLPNGDATEIGERGITISGGQKQRLNIARAIYFDADVVLMDDPLSAVDAHVGRHIFDNAILGLLKDKCRILATHQLWVLNRCDRIIWMDQGRIQAVDTFDNLIRDHAGFQQLMESTALEEKKEEGEGTQTVDANESKGKKKKGKGLMQSEERGVSSVPWSVYANYVRASGSLFNAVLILLLLVVAQGANIMTSLWLSWWTSQKYGLSMGVYIGIYAGLGAVQALLMFSFMVTLTVVGTSASRTMLRDAITRVLRAPMSFFDTTPLGRITNRFSRDVDVLDNTISDAMRMYFFSVASIISVFALIIAFFHYFAIALVPLLFLFLFATSYYRTSAREVKRFESVFRSSVFAKFGEGLSGVSSIRAYGLRDHFIRDLRAAIDEMNAAYYLTFSNQRWLSVRLDMIGNALVFTTGILVVTSRFSVSPSIGGLVLSYILSIVQMIQFTVRQLAEVENGMISVERLQYYGTQIEEEAPLHTVDIRPSWPEKGEIIFDNVEMCYREGLPLVLKGLNMHVRGGERIGIVGRTGAGKSSIMSTLFRLVEISAGRITIDGMDISTIGLNDLRKRLAIIPQDPTLFRGTVRSNLDPFDEHTDLELWSALRQADLVPKDDTTTSPSAPAGAAKDSSRIHLESIVEEDGLNFSLGQRQLMALARALVRGSQIIVCDEATSSVDMETDDKIQATIASGFRGKTLLCIAHRLRTIIGYDRICVMDQGRIAELDTPLNLWKMEVGIFRGMCDRSGIRVEDIRGAREGLKLAEGEGQGEGMGRVRSWDEMGGGSVVSEEKKMEEKME
ncbi:Oligomycin resistance ATP-dependent permease YOR1 [Cytospora mali]|uniref:Oligomycin resistance ATP-dependent permease YOR1 n=1 Tax=Cytospora mali TaxID=578113 RepID=A0A194W5G2_CYTMA|nr:Oligomycin resistance ATP-dependent permease YOR1 [Valsa mali]